MASYLLSYPTLGIPTIPHFREVPNRPIRGVFSSTSFFFGGILKAEEMWKGWTKNLLLIKPLLTKWRTDIKCACSCVLPHHMISLAHYLSLPQGSHPYYNDVHEMGNDICEKICIWFAKIPSRVRMLLPFICHSEIKMASSLSSAEVSVFNT